MKSNTYSLLNSAWFVSDSYSIGMMPSLLNILNKASFEKTESVEFLSVFNIEQASHSIGATSGVESPYVAVIDIKSPIFKYDQNCGPVGTRSIKSKMESMKGDPNLKGIVFDIDSGGGQVMGTPEFHAYLLTYPKPTVTYTDGVLASAAYYIAAGTDFIIAEKHCMEIGSIGTMMSKVDLSGKMEKEGVVIEQVYASKSTKKNAVSRIEDKETQKNAVIVKYLDPINETFLEDIKTAKNITDEAVFAGDVFRSKEALENGLIDEIGTLQTAINKVIELSDQNPITQNNSKMSQGKLPLITAALSLEAALGANEKGTYLNEDQLLTIEGLLAEKDQSIEALKSDNVDLTAKHKVDMDALKADVADKESALLNEKSTKESFAKKLGLEANATNTEVLDKIGALNASPGAAHGTPPSDPQAGSNKEINFESSIYDL